MLANRQRVTKCVSLRPLTGTPKLAATLAAKINEVLKEEEK